MRRCSSSHADDVVADVFLVAWRRLGDVPDDALPWLLGTARRVLANYTRAQNRRSALRERLSAEASTGPAGVPGDSDRTLLRALARLRPADREALLLVAWEGLEPARAARVLGVRPATFGVRLHRARRRLAAALGAEERGDNRELPDRKPMEVSS